DVARGIFTRYQQSRRAQMAEAVVKPLGQHQADENAAPGGLLPAIPRLRFARPSWRLTSLVQQPDAAGRAMPALVEALIALRAHHGHGMQPPPFEESRV